MDIGKFCEGCSFEGRESDNHKQYQKEVVVKGYCASAFINNHPVIFADSGVEINGKTYIRGDKEGIQKAIEMETGNRLVSSGEVY
jgi:hypothetical protein